jgi:hypothetical protein
MMCAVRVRRRWVLGTAAYAALVAAVTWWWSARPAGGFSLAEAAAIALLLPTFVVLAPVTYVVLVLGWNVSGASADQGHVPPGIVITYVAWFTLLAVTNSAFIYLLLGFVRRGRRPGSPRMPAGGTRQR